MKHAKNTLLVNLTNFPPNGYVFRQPEINWPPSGYNFLKGLEEVAKDLSQARSNNPTSGLDPSLSACIEDIKFYTCKRLRGNPRFCAEPAQETVVAKKLSETKSVQRKKKGGCCGRR